VVGANDAAPRLLVASAPARAGWLGVAPCPGLADARWLARSVIVTTSPANGPALPPLLRRPHRDGSYASARDARVVAGFGAASARAVELRAAGPNGDSGGVRWLAPPEHAYLLWCPEARR
jgi:hypothetical protein